VWCHGGDWLRAIPVQGHHLLSLHQYRPAQHHGQRRSRHTLLQCPVDDAPARVRAALPAGVYDPFLPVPVPVSGPWILPATDVVFDVDATTGARRVLAVSAITKTVTYAGKLCGERVTIEQAFPATPDDINAWQKRVQHQCRLWRLYGVRPDELTVYGALIDVDSGGALAFHTVARRPAGSLASVVLAADGALAHIGTAARLRLAWQSAAALATLQAGGRVHGAVTPTNVLLSSVDDGDAAGQLVGYKSTDGTTGSAAGDVRDWGELAWRVLTGAPTLPTGGHPPTALLVDCGVPAAVVNTISDCLSVHPKARPTMAAVTRTLAAALARSEVAPATSRTASDTPPRSSAAAARDAMLQLALKTTSFEVTRALVASGAGGAATATLRAFVADMEVVRAACVALRNLSKACDAEAAVQLQKDGVGAALAAALLVHASDTEVLRDACNMLHNLAAHEPVRGPLVQRDGVGGALVASLRSGATDVPVEVVRTVCTTLQNLAAAPDHAQALCRLGCGAAVVATLTRYATKGAEVTAAACNALCNLAAVRDGADAAQLCDHGAPHIIIFALQRYADNVEVARAVCGTLKNLGAHDAARERLMRVCGIGSELVAALQRHVSDRDVAATGCWALKSLAVNGAGRALLAREDGSAGAAVAAALQQHADDASVAHAALSVLWEISVFEKCRVPLVRNHGAAAAIVMAAQRHADNLEVARAACCMLRNLAVPADACALLVRNASIVDTMVAVLQRHGSDEQVATLGCVALCYLAELKSGVRHLARNASACTAVVAVLLQHVINASVGIAALRALWNKSADKSMCVRLLQETAVLPAMVAALQQHADNAKMALAACKMLHHLGTNARKLLVVEQAAVNTLVAALQRHGNDAEVAGTGCWALHKIAKVEANQTLFVPERCTVVVVGLVRRHLEESEVVKAACCALLTLVRTRTVPWALLHAEGADAAVLAALRRHVGSSANTVYAITRTLSYTAKFCCAHLSQLTSEHTAALQYIMSAHPSHCNMQLCCDDLLTLLH